jgi:UDP-N-acetylglucosamine diphosphorylase/glucosamine-1-phosphate N-acetyltransferase
LKAVILAAGKGERLKPLTESRPKVMLPLCGVPLLEWTLKGLAGVGVEEVLVVTHHMEEQIRGYFGDGSGLELKISYIRQEEIRGTANAFSIAENFVDGDEFVGVYGDLFITPGGFRALLATHRKGDTTMAVVPVDDPSRLGVVKLEGDRVIDIVEKPAPGTEPSNLANAGIYIFSPEIFHWIGETGLSRRNEYEVTDSLKALIDFGSNVRAVTLPKNCWLDVGLPWNLLEANARALRVMEPSVEGEVEDGAHIRGRVKISEEARVRSGVYIEGPAFIGPGSDIGPNCYIRPSTSIGANVRIGNACEVKNSIIMDGTHVAHLSYVGDSIIGQNCNLGAGTITANIRFDKMNVKVNIKDRRVDSGRRKLGAIIGDEVQTGINVNLMTGVKVGSGVWIAPGLTVYDDVPTGVFLKSSTLASKIKR